MSAVLLNAQWSTKCSLPDNAGIKTEPRISQLVSSPFLLAFDSQERACPIDRIPPFTKCSLPNSAGALIGPGPCSDPLGWSKKKKKKPLTDITFNLIVIIY